MSHYYRACRSLKDALTLTRRFHRVQSGLAEGCSILYERDQNSFLGLPEDEDEDGAGDILVVPRARRRRRGKVIAQRKDKKKCGCTMPLPAG